MVGSGATELLLNVGDMTGTLLLADASQLVKLHLAATLVHSSKFESSAVHALHCCDKTQVHAKEAEQSDAIVVVDKVATSQ
jgi:uncharacterized protein (DUF2336 family)